jgi:hypothetical protein
VQSGRVSGLAGAATASRSLSNASDRFPSSAPPRLGHSDFGALSFRTQGLSVFILLGKTRARNSGPNRQAESSSVTSRAIGTVKTRCAGLCSWISAKLTTNTDICFGSLNYAFFPHIEIPTIAFSVECNTRAPSRRLL